MNIKNKIKLKIRKAFTLTEVLVTTLIFSIVLTGVASFVILTYKETDKAYAINNSRMISDLVNGIFTRKIRNAKELSVVNSTKLVITNTDNTTTTYSYDATHKAILVNNNTLNLPNMSKISNEVTNLHFSAGTPKTKNVGIDFELETNSGDHVIKNGFHSSFFCRN